MVFVDETLQGRCLPLQPQVAQINRLRARRTRCDRNRQRRGLYTLSQIQSDVAPVTRRQFEGGTKHNVPDVIQQHHVDERRLSTPDASEVELVDVQIGIAECEVRNKTIVEYQPRLTAIQVRKPGAIL